MSSLFSPLRDVYSRLYQRDAALTVGGLINGLAGVGLLLWLPFESRQFLGIPVWIKPIKFFLSSTIYFWTLSILLPHLRIRYPRTTRLISWSVVVTILIENGLITVQAGRGVGSHFNGSTLLNGLMLLTMALLITWNTLVILWATGLFLRTPLPLPKAYLWGIRFGFGLFLLGSLVGGVMVGLNSHNVGVAMGGPGLPFTNWSSRGGDLRIAHFLGLHALQVLPLSGYLLSQRPTSHALRPTLLITTLAIAYAALTVSLYMQAMNGHPLLAGR